MADEVKTHVALCLTTSIRKGTGRVGAVQEDEGAVEPVEVYEMAQSSEVGVLVESVFLHLPHVLEGDSVICLGTATPLPDVLDDRRLIGVEQLVDFGDHLGDIPPTG